MRCQNLKRTSEPNLKSAALPLKYETKVTAVEKKKLRLLDKKVDAEYFPLHWKKCLTVNLKCIP